MMVEDITILGVLDDFPQRFPTQKIMVVLMSIHPRVDMYGMYRPLTLYLSTNSLN